MEKNSVTRRSVLAGSVATIATAGVRAPAAASASPLLDLIAAHKAAQSAQDVAVAEFRRLLTDFDESLANEPIFFKAPSVRGCRADIDASLGRSACEECVYRRTWDDLRLETPNRQAPLDPEDVAQKALLIRYKERKNLQAMEEALAAVVARRETMGVTGAERLLDEAGESWLFLYKALIACEPATQDEAKAKVEYIIGNKEVVDLLADDEEKFATLLRSLAGKRA